jgi:hypothetical protein
MNNLFSKALAVVALASTMSIYAVSEEPKPMDAAAACATQQQQANENSKGAQTNQPQSEESQQDLIQAQDKKWQHDLMGTYGG